MLFLIYNCPPQSFCHKISIICLYKLLRSTFNNSLFSCFQYITFFPILLYIYICIYIYIYMYLYICMYMCVYVYVYGCDHTRREGYWRRVLKTVTPYGLNKLDWLLYLGKLHPQIHTLTHFISSACCLCF